MNRDLAFERKATREAGSPGLVASAESLSAFAQDRAHPGPVETTRVMAGAPEEARDFRREVAEELADARNYLVWELQRPGPPRSDVRRALTLVVAAWAALGFVPEAPLPATPEAPTAPIGSGPTRLVPPDATPVPAPAPTPPATAPRPDALTRTAPHGDPLR